MLLVLQTVLASPRKALVAVRGHRAAPVSLGFRPPKSSHPQVW